MPEREPAGERVYRGIALAGGVAHARVLRISQGEPEIPDHSIPAGETERELERFHHALVATRHQIQEVQRRVTAAMGAHEAGIFEAHLLVLEDVTLLSQVKSLIRDKHRNAEAAFNVVASRYASALDAAEDEYLRERAADIRDVASRVLNQLLGLSGESELSRIREPVVLVAHDITPSMTAMIDRTKVLGFATDVGGKTSHTAIMARKLRIPAVAGLGDASRKIQTGDYALVDGHGGALIVHPTDATLFQYGQIRERHAALEQRLADLRDQAAVTLDGTRLILASNIEEPSDVAAVRASGSEGVGLFRTEFIFLNRAEAPNEEQQFQAYRDVVAACAPSPVVIRTLDLGGDKVFPGQQVDANPFLGWRAIRISLAHTDLFRAQLRAILRASAFGCAKLMYPMISSVEELVAANQLLESCRAELKAEGIAFDPTMEVGAMIEIPSAALIADALAPHVQFFSLGTNDLTQYTLAVDRMNDRVAHLHCPTHPAVLRLIQMTVAAARRSGAWVGVCGEMAGDPSMLPLLVGLGVDELSATPAVIPAAKFLLRRMRTSEARDLADRALKLSTAEETLRISHEFARSVAPELFDAGK